MVGGVLEANKSWDIGKEVTASISKAYPGAFPIRPKVRLLDTLKVIVDVQIYLTEN